jgi:hypothetical protein
MNGNEHLRDLFHHFDVHDADEELQKTELRHAVFTTLDSVQVLTSILELFTVQLFESQAEIWDTVSQNHYWDQENKLMDYYRQQIDRPDTDSDSSF